MASAHAPTTGHSALLRARDLILPVGIIACILVILVPLPAALMDMLLIGMITLSVIVLLTTVQVGRPLEFSIFPSLLLAATLGRLVLNIATTRLILTEAESNGAGAAGGVIQTFGDFVARGNIVVGVIIFSIIVLIQFVVITKGATRVSEVAARFTLDSLPGRQMAIDADLAAGAIDDQEALRRRQELGREADFFAAMDGASKFVRGDAVAGVAITLVNIVGGLVIGVVQAGMAPGQALDVFTKLTIGDGLASQIPALLISLAAGLLVTRSSQHTNLPSEFLQQLFSRPQALIVAGGFLCLLAFTSLPRIPLLLLAVSCAGLAYQLTRKPKQENTPTADDKTRPSDPVKTQPEDLLSVEPLEIELGLALVRLADRARDGDLLEQIQDVRKQVAGQLGILMPKVRVRDNMRLQRDEYRIKLAEMTVDHGSCSDSKTLAARLRNVVYRHADEILTRDATKQLIDQLRQSSPAVVDELLPKKLSLGEVQQVLQMLLREQVSIRALGTILEALGDYAGQTRDALRLAEYVRQRIARTICAQFRDADSILPAITLAPEIEGRIRDRAEEGTAGTNSRLSAGDIKELCERIEAELTKCRDAGQRPVLLVSPQIRAATRQLIAHAHPHLRVLSYNEITRDTHIQSVAKIEDSAAVPA